MQVLFIPQWILALLLLLGANCVPVSAETDSDLVEMSRALAEKNAFVQANGRQLVKNGRRMTLRSVSFSNFYSSDLGENGFSLDTSKHHSETDFKRVRNLGFNSIRFGLNGNWYLQDPAAFWRWLDRNVDWAEEHEMMLILDMHVPIGGFWLAPNSDDVDFRIWTDTEVRQQNLELWRSIAERYKDKTAIAAYEILNEAVTEDSTGDQWRSLAADLVKVIREVDQNHLLIVGMLYGTERRYKIKEDDYQFLVDDDNVMYDFHFYQPIEFTHQHASWVDPPLGDGGQYPDYSTPIPSGRQILVGDSRISSQTIDAGNSDWKTYRSEWVKLSDPSVIAGLPIMTFRGATHGEVHFDDIKVDEFDVESRKISRLIDEPLTREGVWQWWRWENVEKEMPSAEFRRSHTTGANDQYSLVIKRQPIPDIYSGWSSDSNWFKATPGNLYRITGTMRGEGVGYSEHDQSAFIGFELDFYSGAESEGERAFNFRDKEYLEFEFLKLFKFGIENDVPMSVMEFGLVHQALDMPGKGGDKWIEDILEIFQKYDTSFSLWNYHGANMGLYLSGPESYPSNSNQNLIDVIRRNLRN